MSRNVSFADFHVNYSKQFLNTLYLHEKERPWLSGTQIFDYMNAPNHENFFIALVFQGASLPQLNFSFPNHLKDVFRWSAEHRNYIILEWNNFVSEFYLSLGRPVPDWPAYVDIQESLGIIGSGRYHRAARRFKKTVQKTLMTIFDRICDLFPGWLWAEKKRCYLSGALCETYPLPSGAVSCFG